jgi:hypothetical protein
MRGVALERCVLGNADVPVDPSGQPCWAAMSYRVAKVNRLHQPFTVSNAYVFFSQICWHSDFLRRFMHSVDAPIFPFVRLPYRNWIFIVLLYKIK